MDTAGMHGTAVGLEAAGIEMGSKALHSADLVLWLLDSTRPPELPSNRPTCPVLWVRSKIDLPGAWRATDLRPALNPVLGVSAQRGVDLDELAKAIPQLLVPRPPAAGAAVPFDPTIGAALELAGSELRAGSGQAAQTILAGLLDMAGGELRLATPSPRP
jgi:tRNA modification GTPase